MVTVADPGREFTFTRTELFAGTIEWKHVLVAEGTGTRVLESYTVLKPITIVGWFIIGTLYGLKDQRSNLHNSMVDSLDRLAEIAERRDPRALGPRRST